MSASFTSRRSVLAAAGTASLAAAVAACGDSGSDSGSGEGYGDTQPTGEETSGDSPEAEDNGGRTLAGTSEIPEGGGKIFKDEKVVVTQPAAGEYKAYSAVCQHQGCLVTSVGGGSINCDCHGSKYDIKDGSVTKGPATEGLPEVNVSVEGGSIRTA